MHSTLDDNRIAQRRVRIRIPKQYHQEPVISYLVSHFQITVNITAAILGANANGDGWFDLELRGTNTHVQDALTYLQEMNLEVWKETDVDGW